MDEQVAKPGEAAAVPIHTSVDRRRWRSRPVWPAVATLLTVGGVVAAVLAATAVAKSNREKAYHASATSAAEITAELKEALVHEEDLAVNTGGFMVSNPDASQTEFGSWANSVQVFRRYPEVQTVGMLVIVPAAQLPAYAARVRADPPGDLGPNRTFAVTPAGQRPFYCLTPAILYRSPRARAPAAADGCAGPIGPLFLASRDSGNGSYFPVTTGSHTALVVQTPIYVNGITPATVAARRAAFAGWVGTVIDPTLLLNRTLRGNPHTAVVLRYHAGELDVSFRAGTVPANASSQTADLQRGWTVTTSAPLADGAIFTDSAALRLFIALVTLSLILGLFVFVLGTGRGELRHQALHDALTGLPNRALIKDRMEQLLARSRRDGTPCAALFLDLDDFKNVNDTLGHPAGDQLLIAVAARLAGALRDADTIGRMGGDEFVVLVGGSSLDIAPELVAQRLLAVMREPFDLIGAPTPLVVSVSIGVAIGDRSTAGDLLRAADVALYQAKSGGKNRYEIFHDEMQSTISRRVDLEFEMRSAVAGNQFRLVYQPVYNLEDLTITGVEALVRWDHPIRGVVSPNEFIPILERTGQIQDVGRWVLRAACAQLARWNARGHRLDVSVNVSARQLDDDDIITDIRDALATSGVDPASLIIEITETALMRHVEATARRLRAIKALGVRIAIDDFGTGYSSLAYLRQFPVDDLKIDRMFTNAITTSGESRALLGSLVQLGKSLGLRTLAEGVETTQELALLRDADVDLCQGFLMSRPLDPDAIEAEFLAPTGSALDCH